MGEQLLARQVAPLSGMHGVRASQCAHPTSRRDGYERRRPELTALYQCIAEHWPGFAERMEEAGGLPRFVRDEFEQYLTCGLVDHRLSRARVSELRALGARGVQL
jgi:hypothetical protein